MSRQAMQVSMNEDIIEYTFILIDLLSETVCCFELVGQTCGPCIRAARSLRSNVFGLDPFIHQAIFWGVPGGYCRCGIMRMFHKNVCTDRGTGHKYHSFASAVVFFCADWKLALEETLGSRTCSNIVTTDVIFLLLT